MEGICRIASAQIGDLPSSSWVLRGVGCGVVYCLINDEPAVVGTAVLRDGVSTATVVATVVTTVLRLILVLGLVLVLVLVLALVRSNRS